MKDSKLSIRVTELEKDAIKLKANGNMSRYILRLIEQDDGTDWKAKSESYEELFESTNANLVFVSNLFWLVVPVRWSYFFFVYGGLGRWCGSNQALAFKQK